MSEAKKEKYHFLVHHDRKTKPGVQAPTKEFENDDAAIAFAKKNKQVHRVQSDKTGKYIYEVPAPKEDEDKLILNLEEEPDKK